MVELLEHDAENLIDMLHTSPIFFYLGLLQTSYTIEEAREKTKQGPDDEGTIQLHEGTSKKQL